MEPDSIRGDVWKKNVVVNFDGVTPIVLLLFGISYSPRVHIFLWLLGLNKTITMDNLKKRKMH
jgi:hypothetical protein